VLGDPHYPEALLGQFPGVVMSSATTTVGSSDPDEDARGRDSMSPLVRLFVYHEILDSRAATEGIRPLVLAVLEKTGLIERQGTRVVARFGIDRWGPIAVLHDWPEWNEHPDQVMGFSTAGRSLAWFTPTTRVGRVLDLGTGSGIQAILAATHAEEVVAVDVNKRAVQLATASVCLNGLTNVDVRLGSWFEPVVGSRFDLVVSNPPFVISPEHHFVYRDSGKEGDELCRALLSDAPSHLAPGGVMVMLAEWAGRHGDQDWRATPSRWLRDLVVDGLAIRYRASSPREYATRWNQIEHADPSRRDQAVGAWLAEYERLGLAAFYEGVLALRAHGPGERRPPAHWTVPANRQLDGPAGDQLLRVFNGHTTTEGRTTDEILRAAARPVDGHSLYQEIRYEHGEHLLGQIRAGFGTGLGVDVVISPEDLPLVLSLDTERPVGALLDDSDRDPHQLAELVTALARGGIIDLEMTSGGATS